MTDGALANLPVPAKSAIVIAVVAVVLLARWLFAPDYTERDLALVRAASRGVPPSGALPVGSFAPIASTIDRTTTPDAAGDGVMAARAAYADARTALASLISSVETRLTTDLQPNAQPNTAPDIDRKRSEVPLAENANGLVELIERVARACESIARVCEQLGEHLESDRLERGVLIDAVMTLVQQSSTPPRPAADGMFTRRRVEHSRSWSGS